MSFIIDINQDQFVAEVIEKSKTTPVIVDFWAPWCGPCKQLTPILENLVNKKNGKVILAKINVDENQGIAGQLNIQSIPTVYGFVDGKPIDAFQGAQPENKIEEMINKLIDATPGNEIPKILEEADNLFKDQKFEEAQKVYETLVGMDPGNPKVIGGLLRCLVQLKKYDDAKEMMESLDDETLKDEEILKIKKLLSNLETDKDGDIEELKLLVTNDPNNKEKRFELAEKYLSLNETELGFNELLIIFEKDPKWDDEAAKKKLLEFFDLLGFNDPNVLEARKRLSSLMFK
ncbi:thioredoxin [Alphaproteobacteria bacterium]|nr:thioredoxin [Alphaproteobacteria bacterium]MDB3974135.1 thioredoxin [Alphaproteobacteria bacterium]